MTVRYFGITKGRAKRLMRTKARELKRRGIDSTFSLNHMELFSDPVDCYYYPRSKMFEVMIAIKY
ncbi:TPA: hypothetical protein ACF37A_004214 [Vibrio parahaemolyticus]